MPRDHRADGEMLCGDRHRRAHAALPFGRWDRLRSRVALISLVLLFELSSVALPAMARVPTRSAAAIHDYPTLPPEEWIPVATVPAVVTQEQFDLVREKLSRHKSFARQTELTPTDNVW